jgi:DNA-binding transcriptional MocR family regulator
VTASRGVSPSTVFQAYDQLEALGLVRARARSGYYVLGGAHRIPPELESPSRPADASVPVDVSELVFEILEASMTRNVVPFGSAFPSPLLFPTRSLGRFMASSAQSSDPWSRVDDLSPGNAALRRQIALRYLDEGMQVRTEEIVITNGALEALNLCLSAVTRPGDAVVIEAPTFYAALQALERNGLRAIEVPTHPREGIDLDALEHAIVRHRPKACWLMTNFQNPLGSLMPLQKKKALLDLLNRHELPLIEDDVYAKLYFGTQRPAPAKAFDQNGHGAALRLLLQVSDAKLPHRVGGARAVREDGGSREADDHAGNVCACPDWPGQLHRSSSSKSGRSNYVIYDTVRLGSGGTPL